MPYFRLHVGRVSQPVADRLEQRRTVGRVSQPVPDGFGKSFYWLCLVIAALFSCPAAAQSDKPGLDLGKLADVDRAVAEAIQARKLPGCVVAIGRREKTVYLKAFGNRQIEPSRVPMTTDAVFDLASLTKPLATATSVMRLVERRAIRLEDPVARHLPEFGRNGKEAITVFHLLTHQAGLVPDNALRDYLDGPAKAWERIFALKPSAAPGAKFVYSDVGYLVLGELVRRVSGKGLDEFSRENIFRPLRMGETGFLPGEALRRRAAPADRRDSRWIQGEVHDPRAYHLGGVAGHAGLFSTASDLAAYAQMMLGEGQCHGVRVLEKETVETMIRPYPVSAGLRGLGWDIRTGYSTNRGEGMSPRAFGHGGFTGTALWIDPGMDLFVIFLSNRLHPDGRGEVNRLAGRIGAIAAAACRQEVLTGIDVLQRDGFRQLAGRRVGLITNQTGVNRQGASTATILHDAAGMKLVALFSPEHGFRGNLDVAQIHSGRDETTSLPIHSLYGKTRKPTPEMLREIDTLVFDIQDIGTRFYTYISTMGLAMEAAAEHKLRFVVLDRPNPINGRDVAGPMLDPGRESFVGFHRLPVRHGMTVGELAALFNAERKLGVDLLVVKAAGWRRDDFFDATGLPWINPSPNMRSLTEAILYPGIGLLETTNLSVGRGTDTPFEVLGAPWLDGRRMAEALNRRGLPGVRFDPVEFTPASSVFQGKKCGGVRLHLADRRTFEPLRAGIEIACWLRANYCETWDARSFDRLLGNRAACESVLAGQSAAEIEARCRPGLEEFVRQRASYLLYQ